MTSKNDQIGLAQLTPYLALLLVQLLFGFNFAASKVILEQFPPLLWAGSRLLVASGLMFLTAFLVVPRDQRKVDRSFLKHCLVYGLIGIGIGQAFFLLGLKNTTTQNSAIINSLTPILTLGIAILMGREKMTLYRFLGFAIALTGVLILRKVEDFSLSSGTLKGDFLTLISCISLALFFAISRPFLQANSAFWVTAWMFLFSSIVLLIAAIPDFAVIGPIHFDLRLCGAIVYNLIGATMVTYFLNSWTLKRVSPSSVAVFIYLQPTIAVFNAWFSFGEVPTGRMIVAILCIFAGMCFGILRGAPKKDTVSK